MSSDGSPMFTSAKIRDGSTYLDKHLAKNDYYHKGNAQVKGQWIGKLADHWNLSGPIEAGDKAFENLRQNLTPDGLAKLTCRDRGERAIKFYDFQCSAQKSVSIMERIMEDSRLREAHERCSRIAFAELEQSAARQVNGLTHGRENTGKLLAAAFTHDSSRELDPQLHTHFVISNVTIGQNGTRYALEIYDICKAVRYAGKVYQNEMAKACKELGYEIELVRDNKQRVTGFEIVGVGEQLRELFSKRRAQVEQGIAEFEQKYGRPPNVIETTDITKKTRSFALTEISTEEVHELQLKQLTPEQKQQLAKTYQDSLARNPKKDKGEEKEAWSYAVEHIFERITVVQQHVLMAEAISSHLGSIDLAQLKQIASQDIAIAKLAGTGLQTQVTTPEALRREARAIRYVDDHKGTENPLKEFGVRFRGKLSEEQKKGVEFVCESQDKVMAIRGVAGAGKTTLLSELDRNLNHINRLYLAPTSSAVAVLKAEGFKATTVSDYLLRSSNYKEPEEWRGALIVVDEAGLLSQKQGSEVLKLARKHDNRVLLVGDVKQHSSIEAGDFLRVLETHSKLATYSLTEIRRQKPPEYNAAIRLMAQSQCIQGLHALDEMGWVHENGAGYLRNAAETYLEKRKTGSVLAVTPTWKENHELTDLIRAGLKEEGVLKGNPVKVETLSKLNWTVAQKSLSSNFEAGQWIIATHGKAGPIEQGKVKQVASIEKAHVVFEDGTKLNVRQYGHQIDVANYRVMELQEGDKVQLMANDKKKGLFNGDVYTIQSWNRDGSIKTVEGKDIPADFLGLAHGYVLTSHKSQGKTADHVVVAAEKLNSKACYVASSRGRDSATIHTVDKDRLYAGLPQSEDRLSVSDVLKATQAKDRYKLLKTLDDPREIIRRYWESGPKSNPLIPTHQTPDPAEIERQRQQNSGPSFGR